MLSYHKLFFFASLLAITYALPSSEKLRELLFMTDQLGHTELLPPFPPATPASTNATDGCQSADGAPVCL